MRIVSAVEAEVDLPAELICAVVLGGLAVKLDVMVIGPSLDGLMVVGSQNQQS